MKKNEVTYAMDIKDAHIRNLRLQIAKIISDKDEPEKELVKKYSIQDIRQMFFFREKDIAVYLPEMFSKKDNDYSLKHDDRLFLEKLVERNNRFKVDDSTINNCLNEYNNFMSNINLYQYNNQEFEEFYNKIEEDVEMLHWCSLPIYEDKFISDRDMLPEDNVKEYYRDFYTLKDLMYWLKIGYKTWKPSIKGDCNLNKELRFRVYSRRWGHYDSYAIIRTTEGWHVEFISIKGECEKNGRPKLFDNLDHDYILYSSNGLEEAMETLWDLADSREMSVHELQDKLSDIAEWISEIEKAHANYKPDWLLY